MTCCLLLSKLEIIIMHGYTLFSLFIVGQIAFDNYREFLLYMFNSLVADGKIDEILGLIKSQPKGKVFNFESNTQEGMYFFVTIFLISILPMFMKCAYQYCV